MSDKTPAKGEMVLLPSGVIRTQQVTLVAIVTVAFVFGGFFVSLKRDVSDVAEKQRNAQAWMFEAIKAISPTAVSKLPPPDLFTAPKGP